jgi:hypothetical protein
VKYYNDDILPPVLFNPWKHHLKFIQSEINQAAKCGEVNLSRLRGGLLSIGDSITDLYTGGLSPTDISSFIINDLRTSGLLERDAYAGWINKAKNSYRMIGLPDSSIWTLRIGEEKNRYIHIHPGRYSPQSFRIRAGTLKSAVSTLVWTKINGSSPYETDTVNKARKHFLNVSPVKSVSLNYGLGKLIKILEES